MNSLLTARETASLQQAAADLVRHYRTTSDARAAVYHAAASVAGPLPTRGKARRKRRTTAGTGGRL